MSFPSTRAREKNAPSMTLSPFGDLIASGNIFNMSSKPRAVVAIAFFISEISNSSLIRRISDR